MAAVASAMLATNGRPCPGVADRLGADVLAQLMPKATHSDEVDLGAERLLESLLKIEDAKVAQPSARQVVDEHVEVAVVAGLVAGEGSEHGRLADAHRRELPPMRGEHAKSIVPFHLGYLL
jgi:hypothetical protein